MPTLRSPLVPKMPDSFDRPQGKIILVGDTGVGKTTLANRIVNPDWCQVPKLWVTIFRRQAVSEALVWRV